MRGVSLPAVGARAGEGSRQVPSSPSQAHLGAGCAARPRHLTLASQHESILARSHKRVLEDRDTVIVSLLHKRRRIVADLERGDEREGVLCVARQDCGGWRDIMIRGTVEELCIVQFVCMLVPMRQKKLAVAYLNGGAFPGSCLRLKRHCPARGPAGHDMVQLPELAIAQHAQVE